MRKLLLSLSFDGTAFHGWQVQPNGVTVQQCLQDALERLYGIRPDVTGCSRTDAGVHARQFCCHYCDSGRLKTREIVGALNAFLPKTVSVRECIEVPLDFHARYSCIEKQYIYRMYVSRTRDPFLEGYALRLIRPLDLFAAGQFCNAVTGAHDFIGFSSSGRTTEDTVRTVRDCHMEQAGFEYRFVISADGFLYNMVRILVGTLLWVCEGKIDPAEVPKILASKNRSLAGPTAPPYGLYLEQVFFGEGQVKPDAAI